MFFIAFLGLHAVKNRIRQIEHVWLTILWIIGYIRNILFKNCRHCSERRTGQRCFDFIMIFLLVFEHHFILGRRIYWLAKLMNIKFLSIMSKMRSAWCGLFLVCNFLLLFRVLYDKSRLNNSKRDSQIGFKLGLVLLRATPQTNVYFKKL